MAMFDSPQFNLLQRALDATALRQQVLANNIANVDTPNFKRSDVRFGDLLQRKMNAGGTTFAGKRDDPRQLIIGQGAASPVPEPEVVVDQSTSMNNDNNNVDIDAEMSRLAKNQLENETMQETMTSQLKMLRNVIDGR